MKKMNVFTLLVATVGLSSLTLAANIENGKKLHEAHCTACHIGMTGGDGSLLYTRKNRRVNSLDALNNQVRRCESNLELKWFEEDIEDVVHYLNTRFYAFPTEK
jgi:mono/diheme cytochrome c family protein